MERISLNSQKVNNPREFFGELYNSLSLEAKKSDVGFYVQKCQGAFVNNFREGWELTIRERLDYLRNEMTEKRNGNTSLSTLFPGDWKIIQSIK